MPTIEFDSISKTFGDNQVLKPFSLTVEDGEFLVLLGPSGCGKSTLLRMIAGLTNTTSGSIHFDDADVTQQDVRHRDLAFVFQSYALYPQMTVRENIAFPLLMDRMRGWQHLPIVTGFVKRKIMKEPAVVQQVDELANQLGLKELLHRRPAALSGGQRQRVALARSLVRDPSLYLLDEPLSNLDAKLRTQMRMDITSLHKRVGKTFIYVTHDQIEAITMATRIVVMNQGVIQQVGTPAEIYDQPRNVFVATFVGSPPTNLMDGDLFFHERQSNLHTLPAGNLPQDVLVGVRPENLTIAGSRELGVPAVIKTVERTGAETMVGCQLRGREDHPPVFVKAPSHEVFEVDAECTIQAVPERVLLFDKDSRERLPGTTPTTDISTEAIMKQCSNHEGNLHHA